MATKRTQRPADMTYVIRDEWSIRSGTGRAGQTRNFQLL